MPLDPGLVLGLELKVELGLKVGLSLDNFIAFRGCAGRLTKRLRLNPIMFNSNTCERFNLGVRERRIVVSPRDVLQRSNA